MGCRFDYMPDAGMYFLATLPEDIDAQLVADSLFDQGHLFAPGNLFLSMEHTSTTNKMRFNIAHMFESSSLSSLEEFLRCS